ncbi:O-antigen/teichoic acid export membrane protein [Litorimonas taeanensis]|uniref:O-antigen/teichoic acid export membrane protein n=1 Tax=Litorimonas taeanensis TaxID=568099 RepID=A0A420WKM6_9PROT|nr:O-antigen/teichoic acid export membrane protein [Litorimonas taeanensis]
MAANAGWLMGAKTIGMLMGLATLIITERALDNQVSFGIIIFLHAYMLFFAEVATFQTWQSIIRFGSVDQSEKNAEKLGGLIKFSAKIDVFSALFAYGSAVLLFGAYVALVKAFPGLAPKADGFNIEELKPLVFMYSTVVLFQLTGTPIGVLRLFDKFQWLAFAALVMPFLRLGGAILAMTMGWGVIGFLCVWWFASVFAYLFKIGLGLYEVCWRNLFKLIWHSDEKFLSPRKGLWSFVWKSNVDSTLAAGVSHLPALLVMAVFGPAFVAIYRIAEEIAKLLSEGVKLIDQAIYPELARIISNKRGGQILKLVTKASVISLSVGLLLSFVIFITGPFIMASTLGEEYKASVLLAVILVFGAALYAAVAPLFPVFYAANKPERAIYARLAGLVAYIAGFFFLTRLVGEYGAAIAVVVGYFVSMMVVGILIKHTINGLNKEARLAIVNDTKSKGACGD